jgi:F-type H+-transporting ATPase subunit b
MDLALIAAEAGNNFWLPHDIKEVLWGTIAFVLVGYLLVKKAGPPMKQAFNARSQRIAAELETAEEDRKSAEGTRDAVRDALAGSDAEAARIIEEGRNTAVKLKADLLARAEADAVAVQERAEGEIAAARRQAQSDLSAEISRLSLGAAEAVVHRNLDDATQQSLIEAYINQVGAAN